MTPSAVAVSSTGPTPLGRPSIQIALSIVGSVCGTLVSGAVGTSPTGQLIAAALGASIPTLITVVGPGHGVRAGAGVAVTALAVLVTYGGATARDFATDSPATFPLIPGVASPGPGSEEHGQSNPGPTGTVAPPDSVNQHDDKGRRIRVTPGVLACTPAGCSSPVQIESVGEAPFTVTGNELESEFFHADANCVGRTLAPGDDCSFEVRYTPGPGGEPHKAKLIIHQTLSGNPTTVQLEGTGAGEAAAVDLPAPKVESCEFATGGSGQLQAAVRLSLTAAGDGVPETVSLSAGLAGEDADAQEATLDGATVDLVVPIPDEKAQAGLVIEIETDPGQDVVETDEANNGTTVTSTSVPVAGAACTA
jgi:hypothetical protein